MTAPWERALDKAITEYGVSMGYVERTRSDLSTSCCHAAQAAATKAEIFRIVTEAIGAVEKRALMAEGEASSGEFRSVSDGAGR